MGRTRHRHGTQCLFEAPSRHLDYHAQHLPVSASKPSQDIYRGDPGFASVKNCRGNTGVEEFQAARQGISSRSELLL
eukprot:5157240-Pyramimonas_sp.AAC.1